SKVVRSGVVYLPFDSYTPQRDAVEQCLVFCDWINVVTRVIRVVIHAVHGDSVPPRCIEKRGFADPGILQDLGVGIHVYDCLQRRFALTTIAYFCSTTVLRITQALALYAICVSRVAGVSTPAARAKYPGMT